MQFNGLKPSANPSSATAASVLADAQPLPTADTNSPNYASPRQQRLAERLRSAGDRSAACWNHLITVVVWGADADDIAALPRTLGSLLAQRYRNFEVLMVGKPNVCPSDTGDFTGCRGLFAAPYIDALDILSDPATDPLWRGSHLVLVSAGAEFDPDAIELLNAALDNVPDASAPALVLCENPSLAEESNTCPPAGLPDCPADVVRSLDKRGMTVMVSRTLLQLARQPRHRPTSLQEWLRGISTMIPASHTVHLAETLIHDPPEPHLSSRFAPGIAP
jgi:hypothetical protein